MNATSAADLAVVGGGPRALSALVHLDDALAGHPATAPLQVLLLEPGVPGAGTVWDPTQPHHLVMNVDASLVDFRGRSVEASFRSWEQQQGWPAEPYPPRARVGAYLAWAFERLQRSPRLRIRHVPTRVTHLEPRAHGWRLDTPLGPHRAAAVLLCTGHTGTGPDHSALVAATATHGPGQQVAVRGAALTAFDVVLDLTAARGGRWEEAAPGRLRYLASGTEPEHVTLLTRSGDLMVPKPLQVDPTLVAAVRAHTRRWAEGADPDEAWWSRLVQAAGAAAATAGCRLDPTAAHDLLAHGRPATNDPVARWAEDLRRADGHLDDEPAWWLGRAWTAGYPDVVRSLGLAPRDPDTWPMWRERAQRLERWGFGPPAQTLRRLLALVEHGLLSVGTTPPPGAVLVDAVTPGPGVLPAPRPPVGTLPAAVDPLWASLLERGLVSVRPGERGVLTDPAARAVAADGSVREDLAVLGRPTEDPVIGHDTLSRTLHPHARAWAASTVRARVARTTGPEGSCA